MDDHGQSETDLKHLDAIRRAFSEDLDLGEISPELMQELDEIYSDLERDDLPAEATLAERPRRTEAEEKSQRQLRAELFRNGSTFKSTSRSEIVGIDNILGEIDEIIHWLRHSKEYGQHQSRLQPGVIFSGNPGTGKTLVSRWIASESKALFVNVREFVHKGELFTDSDIRDLFAHARETYANNGQPIVLFWDEFENAAAERSNEKTTPAQKSVVSQLTAELDGIHGKNEGILLIGCTNYATSIDQALTRRGRMGVHIEFHAPDRQGKEKILKYYLSKMRCRDGIDIDTLSYFFPKHNTAADIEEACVEAWRHAVRRSIDKSGEPYLEDADLVKVFIKQLVGPPTTFTLPENERMPIAIHECGHAIIALTYGVPVRLITVQPGKKSLGRVMVDEIQEYIGTVSDKIDHMRVGLGGIAAEKTAGLPLMTGTASDISQVNGMAEYLVDHLMAGQQTGILNITAFARQVNYANLIPQISESMVARSDADVLDLIKIVEEDAYHTLEQVGRDNLLQIAQAVNDKVTMTGKEFRQLFIDVCGYNPEKVS